MVVVGRVNLNVQCCIGVHGLKFGTFQHAI